MVCLGRRAAMATDNLGSGAQSSASDPAAIPHREIPSFASESSHMYVLSQTHRISAFTSVKFM